MTAVGQFALWAALAAAVLAALSLTRNAPAARERTMRHARIALVAGAAACTLAVLALLVLLWTRSFGVAYVYRHTSSTLGPLYTTSALWAGQAGSLLLWLWLVTLAGAVVARRGERASVLVMAGIICYLALLLILQANPFAPLSPVPDEGLGLNPLLESLWMAIHPPLVFAAYAAYGAAFAWALAGAQHPKDGHWRHGLRAWALAGWVLLSAGMLLGARWAYVELGWGGYWGWDPVENASLLPWLAGTALLHTLSGPAGRERRLTSLWLATTTLTLCFLVAYITRGGAVRSVHAYAQSAASHAYAAPLLMVPLAMAGVLFWRRRKAAVVDDSAARRTATGEPGLLSRETGSVVMLVLLGNMALATLLGTVLPSLSLATTGREMSIGAAFYMRTVAPLGLLLVISMALCPGLAAGGTPPRALLRRLLLPGGVALAVLLGLAVGGEFSGWAVALCLVAGAGAALLQDAAGDARRALQAWRARVPASERVARGARRRRQGARLVHLGAVLVAAAVIGTQGFGNSGRAVLQPGESAPVHGYTLRYDELATELGMDREGRIARLTLLRDGRMLASLAPEKTYYPGIAQYVSEVAIRSSLREDVYVALEGVDGVTIGITVMVVPLVLWLWVGGLLGIAGGVLAWWPSRMGDERTAA